MSQFPFNPSPRTPAVLPPVSTLERLGYAFEDLVRAQETGNLPRAIAILATMAGPGCCTTLLASAPKGFVLSKPGDSVHVLPASRFITVQDMSRSLRIFCESLAKSEWIPTKNDTLYLGFVLPDAVLQEFPHIQYLGHGAYGYQLPDIVIEHFHRNAVADLQLLSQAAQHAPGEAQPAESMAPQG